MAGVILEEDWVNGNEHEKGKARSLGNLGLSRVELIPVYAAHSTRPALLEMKTRRVQSSCASIKAVRENPVIILVWTYL